MNPVLRQIPIAMPIDSALEHRWLLDDGVLQSTIERFSKHPDFIVTLPDKLFYRSLGRKLAQHLPTMRDRIWVGAEELWIRLLQTMERANKTHVMVVPGNACGMPLAGIELLGRLVHDSEVDLVYSDQILGLLPLLVSRKLLEKRIRKPHSNTDGKPLPLRKIPYSSLSLQLHGFLAAKVFDLKRANRQPRDRLTRLHEFCEEGDKIQNIRFFAQPIAPEPIHYLPRLQQDRALARHLVKQADPLENILRKVARLPEPESSPLAAHFKEFCDTFAITYPTYDLTGEPEIPEEIRGLTSNPKSVGDCYLRAINFTKFLKEHAGLRLSSRVLDVGCGWGLLGLGLVNVTEEPGSYIGLDIQRDAIEWAQKNIAPLNPRLSFVHLDIANTRYNPQGSIPYDQVRLPIQSDSIDLVVFSSVFTHMRREGVEQYLKESRRVLVEKGIVAFSYFHSSYFGANQDYAIRFPDNPDRMTLFSTCEIHRILSICGLIQARSQINYTGRFNSAQTFFQTFMFATKQLN